MNILAIDQGPTHSGVAVWNTDLWQVEFANPDMANEDIYKAIARSKRARGASRLRLKLEAEVMDERWVDAKLGRLVVDLLILERFSSYGSTMGETTLASVRWGGIFAGIAHDSGLDWKDIGWMYNATWRSMLVGRSAATESQAKEGMRNMLLDHLHMTGNYEAVRGGGKKWDKGTKKQPGPFHFVTSHSWSALGLATAMHKYLIKVDLAEEFAGQSRETYPLYHLER